MGRSAKLLVVPLLILAAAFFTADSAQAHGDCDGWSSQSRSGTTVRFSGTSECMQEVREISVFSVLWSFDIRNLLTSFHPADDGTMDIDFDDTRVHASDSHPMSRYRCYGTASAHEAVGTHGDWYNPSSWRIHHWFDTSSIPLQQLVCRG